MLPHMTGLVLSATQKKMVEETWTREGLLEEQIEEMVISVGSSTSSESEEDDSDGSSLGVAPLTP